MFTYILGVNFGDGLVEWYKEGLASECPQYQQTRAGSQQQRSVSSLDRAYRQVSAKRSSTWLSCSSLRQQISPYTCAATQCSPPDAAGDAGHGVMVV